MLMPTRYFKTRLGSEAGVDQLAGGLAPALDCLVEVIVVSPN